MDFIIQLFLVLLIIYFFVYYGIETFFDFKNIPKEYGEDIENICKSNTNNIPKIIHHICPKDFNRWHKKWFICYESWLRLFPSPEYTHMHWYDDELHNIVEEEFPWFLEIFNEYDVNIKRIDMVRPFILYKYGGIYADMDYFVYENFYDDLNQDKVNICDSPYKSNEEVTNALMASPPNNNFWLLILDEAYTYKDTYVLLSTGPQLLSKIYARYSELVHVLPYDKFNPPSWEEDMNNVKTKHYNTIMW